MKKITIKGLNKLSLNCYLYEPEGKAKAVIQIIHGMQEHAYRYNEFAEFLARNGYYVLASDLRGHGYTAHGPDKLGHSDGDIFSETIEDQKIICEYLKERFKLPIYIFGHSYGSFLTQRFMQVCTIPKKFIVCGTTNGSSPIIGMGKFVANLLTAFGKRDKKATTIESMSFKTYAKGFENGNWLSRDDKVWEKYQADDFCGGSFPVSFYKSMFSSLRKLNKGIKLVPNDAKIFFIAGDKDPVGEKGKQVEKLYKIYKKQGKDVELKLYPDCRHELINELNKDQVYSDVLAFYDK